VFLHPAARILRVVIRCPEFFPLGGGKKPPTTMSHSQLCQALIRYRGVEIHPVPIKFTPGSLKQVNEQLKEYARRLEGNTCRTEVALINSQITYLKDIYRYEVAGESEKDAILERINDNVKAVAKTQTAHNRFRVKEGLGVATAVILQTPAILLALPFALPVMAAEYLTR
jgi:hypothetical protein